MGQTLARLLARNFLSQHLDCAWNSLQRLLRNPFAAFLTTLVIGIALALPVGFYMLLDNIWHLGRGLDQPATLTLYVSNQLDEPSLAGMLEGFAQDARIASTVYISREQALEEYRVMSGLDHILDALEENPLPASIVLALAASHQRPEQVEELQGEMQRLPGVDLVRADLQWVQRFQAITRFAQRLVMVIGFLLLLAVLVVIGNSIRLEIYNRRQEIEVYKLVGATDAFVRRPFLYAGLWYGLIGGFWSLLLVLISFWALQGPVNQLAGLYQNSFSLVYMTFLQVQAVMLLAILTGLAGAWLAVGRHLRKIRPGAVF